MKTLFILIMGLGLISSCGKKENKKNEGHSIEALRNSGLTFVPSPGGSQSFMGGYTTGKGLSVLCVNGVSTASQKINELMAFQRSIQTGNNYGRTFEYSGVVITVMQMDNMIAQSLRTLQMVPPFSTYCPQQGSNGVSYLGHSF